MAGVPTLADQSPDLLICQKCDANYVRTQDGLCTPKCPKDYWNGTTCQTGITTQLQNCKLANEMNGTTCMECEQGFLNVAGVCVVYNTTTPIKNCKDYDLQSSFMLPYAQCNKCLDGYYVSDGKKLCLDIPLANCAQWGLDATRNRTWCLRCQNGYALIEKKNQEQYCYKLTFDASLSDNQEQCEEWDSDLFKNRKLKCNKCKLGTTDYFKIDESAEIERKTQCLTFAPNNVECSAFDVIHTAGQDHPEKVTYPTANFGTFFTNTFKCLQCTEDSGEDKYKTYWYDKAYALCRVRSQVPNCRQHSQYKNEC